MDSAVTGQTENVASDVQRSDRLSGQIEQMEIRLTSAIARVLSQRLRNEEQESDKANSESKKGLVSKKPGKRNSGTRRLTFREFLSALWW